VPLEDQDQTLACKHQKSRYQASLWVGLFDAQKLVGSIERLDANLKPYLGYDKLLVAKRNSIFVLLAFLMIGTIVPSAAGLASPCICLESADSFSFDHQFLRFTFVHALIRFISYSS
jgi:hypothetical protein